MMTTRLSLLCIASSAAILVLAFPPFAYGWLAVLAWVPLLRVVSAWRPGRAMLFGLLHGVLLFGGTLHWLCGIFGGAALLMIGVLASFTALFAMSYAAVAHWTENSLWRAVGGAILWVGIEHFRSEWFALAFSWITPATALPPSYLTPWIGSYGCSGCIIASSILLSAAPRQSRIFGACLALLVLIASYVPRELVAPAEQERCVVALVQGESLEWHEFLSQSRAVKEHVDCFVWPELALSFDPREDPLVDAAIRDWLRERGTCYLIVGCRTRGTGRAWKNSALCYGPDGVLGSHDKNRPVPFIHDGAAGTVAGALPLPIGKVGMPICFDLDASHVARRMVAAGAEFLLAPSKDPAAWGEIEHLQHAAVVRHRAAEVGRWIGVASSSGRTQFIDPHGAMHASLPLFDAGVLRAQIDRRTARTPFAAGLWCLAPLCSGASAILILLLLLRAWITRHRAIAN